MVTVRAPATSANLGCGFDVFGLALERPADIVRVERAEETTIEVTGVGEQYIPTEPPKNTAGVVAEELGTPAHIRINKGVRPSSGLGSSAASAAAAAVALNELYDCGLTRRELVRVAAEGEAAVSGEAHADNVAPSILGGFTMVTDDAITQVEASIPVVACLPEIVVSTRDARRVVPQSVDIDELVDTVGNAATLTAGMFRDNPELVGTGLEDGSVTGSRASLIDGFDAVRTAALDAGATGVAVSGAGPSVLAVCHDDGQSAVASAMLDAFSDADVEARAYPTAVGGGATIERR
ncbi:homoserine kinase [Haladaptatus paucihalophilus DX253]|uniref:Homoserine kinase n=1 Tax=Haladaptatus paucihalophilus DX253 TaxID=797209 RepID=E7QNM1_HALPU|nr:homoserine kinase [Haladaptatus paucihalophilus]EFW94138.1 homoserine kinase [Haladaptatus paucihalophilus DX253]SHK60588.1 homoserine kinase [Haladaptatus paucihalophilus DX253]